VADRALNIDAHAQDARVALALAQQGYLDERLRDRAAVALGGSFSSAILHRLLRDTAGSVVAWVTVGGIANAFSGTADFYAGQIQIPPEYTYLIPALGPPNLYPLAFLRYSPVYTAAQLPPTLLIHTDADRIIPISQAYELEAALQRAGVPVTVFYYQDVSHYLQIDDQMTDAGREMFYRVVDFAQHYGK
jgi:acetyl esterase/lipase